MGDAVTEQWNRRAQTELRVEGCRRRGPQANPRPEPNLTVRRPPRGRPTARVIILPRKPAKLQPWGHPYRKRTHVAG